MASLKGKVALITGSSSGIGATTAELLAKHGCYVSITGRNERRLNEVRDKCFAAGLKKNQVMTTVGDITSDAVQNQLLENTLKLGPISILINNAGIGGGEAGAMFCSIQESMEVFDRIMNVNLRSVVSLTKLALPHLEKTKGSIVNVSTVGAFKAVPPFMYYCVAKAGLDHFTRCLAAEVGSKGIRANCVNPGGVETNFAANLGVTEEQMLAYKAMAAKTYPLGRIGQPDEIARLIVYLASDDASFTTGQTHLIDGGLLVNYRTD